MRKFIPKKIREQDLPHADTQFEQSTSVLSPQTQTGTSQDAVLNTLAAIEAGNSQYMRELIAFNRMIFAGIIFVTTIAVLVVLGITFLFLVFPDQTISMLGYEETPLQARERASASHESSSDQVLGVSDAVSQKKPDIPLPIKLLRPIGNVSLELVKFIDKEKYQRIKPYTVAVKAADLFRLDENGNIVPLAAIALPNASYLKTGNNTPLAIDSQKVQGKEPGNEVGDLVVFGEDKTIADLSITSTNLAASSVFGGIGGIIEDESIMGFDIADETITNEKIIDGTLTAAKLASSVAEMLLDGSIPAVKLKDSAVTSAKIEDNTVTSSDLAGTLSFGSGDLIDLSAVTHNSTAKQGLLLPNVSSATPSSPESGEGYLAYDTSGDQVIMYNGSSWSSIGGGGGDITEVLAGSGLSGGGTTGSVTLSSVLGIDITNSELVTDTLDFSAISDSLTLDTATSITAGSALNLIIGNNVTFTTTGTGTITANALAAGTYGVDISGNAATVTNGVYTAGSYVDPSWITSLAGSKISGNISGNAANVTGTVGIGSGGTGQTNAAAAFNALSPLTTIGDILYGGASGAGTRLAGNTATSRLFLRSTGDGVTAAAPVWSTLTALDVGLSNVENTALSTWGGSGNMVTVGTLTSGATGAGFTLNFGASTLSGNIGGSNIDESTLAGLTSANFSSANISQWTNNSGYLTTVDISSNTNLSASNGVTLTGDALSLSSTAGGDGLTYTTGVLAVGAGAGISVAADSISATLGTSISNTELDANTIDLDRVADTLSLDADLVFSAGSGEDITLTKIFTDATSENGFVMNFTAADTSSGTTSQFGLYLDNLASTEGLDAGLVINNSDTDDAVAAAIKIVNAGGGFTTIIDNAGTLISGGELNLLDGKTTLVDTDDAVGTAITGTGTLTSGATGAGFTINLGTSTLSGNVTGANISSLDISDDTNLSASDGITLTGDALTNSDKGSSQFIFKTIAVSGQSNVVTDVNADTITLVAGSNVTLTTDASTDTITIAATDTNTTYSAGNDLDLTGTTFALETTLDFVDTINLTGTGTLNGLDVIDATSESTIESAIDTLGNLTSASSLVTVGTLTGGATGAGFTINFGTSTLSGSVGGTNIDESTLSGIDISGSTNLSASNGVALTGDALSLDQAFAPTWTSAHTFNLTEAEDLQIDIAISGTQAGQGSLITLTNSSSSGNQYGLSINNAASSGTTDALIYLDNSDTDTVITSAIQVANTSRFTNIFDIGGTGLTATEVTLLDSGIAVSELSDSGTLTAGTVDINGGTIDGVTIGGASAGAGTFTTITGSDTFDANGIVTLGDGGDAVTIDGSSLALQTTGAGSDITLNAVDQIILTDFANCTALETSSGVLTCGTDDSGGGGTPWTSDIDADGFDLNDLSNVEFRETTGAPAGTVVGLYRDNTGDLSANVLTGKTFNMAVNGTDEYNFSSSVFSLNSNSISTGSTTLTTAELDLLDGKTTLVDTDDAVGTAITGTGTLTSGATGAGFTVNFGTSTLSGNVGGSNIDESTLTGIDISSSTNLSASNGITLTGDALSLDVAYAPTWTSAHTFSLAEAEDLQIDIAISGTQAGQGQLINLTNSSSSGNQYGLSINNVASSGTTDALIYLDNSDTDTVITSAIQIANTSRFTNILDIGGTTLTASEINLLDSGIALNELSDSGTLTASTVDINGGAIDGVTIGANAAGAGTFTTLSSTGASTLGNNSATVAINSSDWDIDTTGVITGVSFDANGSGNSISNIDNADLTNNTIDFTKITDSSSLDADWSLALSAGEDISFNKTFTNNTTENGFVLNFTASDTGAATTGQFGMYLDNTASTEGVDALLVLDNSDTDDAVGAAIKLIDAGGTFTSLFDINGTLLSSAEVTLLNDGVAHSELTDSGTLTVTTADINGGAIDGVTIGGASAGAGTFTTVTLSSTFDANGVVTLGDGGDAITIDGSSLVLQTTGGGSDITLNAVDQIILTDFANCTALETSSGVLTCGTDDTSAGAGIATIEENNATVTSSATVIDFLGTDFTVSGASGEGDISIDYTNSGITRKNQSETIENDWTFSLAEAEDLAINLTISGTTAGQAGLVTLTNSSSSGNQYGLYLDNAASTGTTESLLVLDNSDTDTAITSAIQFLNAGGGFTNLFDVAGTTITSSEFTLLDSGLALSELTDSGTLTAGTVDINGGTIDGTTLGATSRAAANVTTLDTNGTVILGDGSGTDNITLSRGSGNITLTGFTSCTALETNASSQLVCGTDDTGSGGTLTGKSWIDSTSDAVVDATTTDYWDTAAENGTSYPNFTLASASNQVFGIATTEVTSTGTQDTEVVTRVVTHTSTTSMCSNGTEIGSNIGTFSTNTNGAMAGTIHFLYNPGNTTQHFFTLCSDDQTIGTGANVTRIRFTLFEMTNSADLAEVYPTNDTTLRTGELVSMDSVLTEGVIRSGKAYDPHLMGVVSTEPAMVIGGTDNRGRTGVPVALSGRVPVKVSTDNGPIKVGDLLTSSSIPGVAMRATKAGTIIGQAMTGFAGEGTGEVMVFIKTGYANGATVAELFPDISTLVGAANQTPVALGRLILAKMMDGKVELITDTKLSEVTTDRVVAGLEVITPRIVADEIIARSIKAERIEGLEIVTGKISELAANIDSLEALVNSSNVSTNKIAEGSELASASAKLSTNRSFGSTLIEGVLEVLDQLKTNNLLVAGFADFFGNVFFRSDVSIAGKVALGRDSTGVVIVRQGSDRVVVTFEKAYSKTPLVNASVSLEAIGDEGTQEAVEQAILQGDIRYIITRRSPTGFVIRLSKAAIMDIPFHWTAVLGSSSQQPSNWVQATPTPMQSEQGQESSAPSGQEAPVNSTPTPSFAPTTIPEATPEVTVAPSPIESSTPSVAPTQTP